MLKDIIFRDESKETFYLKIARFRELSIGIVALIIFFISSIIEPRFLQYETIRTILLYIPLILTVAMGEMLVIITGNIDLSVGSTLGFSGIVIGLLFIKNPNFPIFLAFILSALIGAILGAINGFLITSLRLPSIIVTLGTLSVYRGLLFIVSGGRQIDPNDIPEKLIHLSQTSPVKIPWIVIFVMIFCLMVAIFLNNTFLGRRIYAVGSNQLAAKLRGINTKGIIFFVYMISGMFAGISGIMYASRFGYVNPGMTGVGMELTAIAATVIGGTKITGGSGSVQGTVFGCILLGVINTALAVLGISAFWQKASYGLVILFALIIDKTVENKLNQAMKEGRRI